MRRGPALLALSLALALGAGSCDLLTGPKAGELAVVLSAPLSGDVAILFSVTGAVDSVRAASAGYRAFSRKLPPTTTRVAVVGALTAGPLVRIAVPDVKEVAAYRAVVLEVAGPSYALNPTGGYTLSVVRP